MGVKLKDILAISGQPGLYKFVKQGRNGIIVESLDTKKRMNAHATEKISSLEDITIFTEEEDAKLSDVMESIFEKENKGESINHKKTPNEELKKYFEEVLPEYDKDRVYVSDIKKIINWYNILQRLDMIEIVEDTEEESKDEDKEATTDVKDKTDSKETENKPSIKEKNTTSEKKTVTKENK